MIIFVIKSNGDCKDFNHINNQQVKYGNYTYDYKK